MDSKINTAEFQTVWSQAYGQELNESEAFGMAKDLVRYFEVLAEMERQKHGQKSSIIG